MQDNLREIIELECPLPGEPQEIRDQILQFIEENPILRRWPHEPLRMYHNFLLFAQMGPARSYTALARLLACKPSTIKKQAQKFGWIERAAVYDQLRADAELTFSLIQRKEMLERHAGLAVKMGEKVSEALDQIDTSQMNSKDIIDMFKASVAIERQARGIPDENNGEKVSIQLVPAKPPEDTQ
ncbi:hypothetical protein [Thermogutta sp.]|uniref:hypothetical protein n=1 Tax=Thermogutta sp. TaxID=1962930 RepID=UPI0032207191